MTHLNQHPSDQDWDEDPSGHPGSSDRASVQNFLTPRHSYRGQFTPQNLAFNANLQEFSQQIGYICALETSGKLPPHEAYKRVKKLYKQLRDSKKALGIGDGDSSTNLED
nr:hypothetical protein [Prochlorothrix hollandica]